MQSRITLGKVETYIRANWFTLVMVGMVVFIFLRKDFSFSVNFNNPQRVEEKTTPLKEEVYQKKTTKKSAPISVKQPVAKAGSAMFDMLPSISSKGSTSKPKRSELAAIDELTKERYISRFAKVAVNERKKFGVPASITIANALLHSCGGTRDMVIVGNNHFGLPCTTNWNGESGTYNDACYRHYENAWTSFRDHSLYLTTGSTSNFVKLGSTDYKAWAKNMEKVALFEIKNLADELIRIIEQYELYKLDA